jgi:Ca2+/Na+ antiporter
VPEEKLISTTDLQKSQEDATISVQEIEEGVKAELALDQKHLKNPYSDKNTQHPAEETALQRQERFMHMVERICFVVIWPLAKILPIQKFPELAVVLIFLIIYIMVEFVVTVMNVFSAYTGMSHFMVGLTLMVWGSDNMEMLNLAIAIGKGEEEMALIAVLSC